MSVRCQESPVLAGSATLAVLGALVLCLAEPAGYGKYKTASVKLRDLKKYSQKPSNSK